MEVLKKMNKTKRRVRRNIRRDTMLHWKPTFMRELLDNLLRMRKSKAHYFSDSRAWRKTWRSRYYNASVGKY